MSKGETKKERVVVGMSGGVDSSVAAYLLKEAGYDVIGVTIRTWEKNEGIYSRCCDIDDARSVACKLGIPYYPVYCVNDFNKYVVDRFERDYLNGITPNPCVECNRYVKFSKLLDCAKLANAKYIATGHYASAIGLGNGRYTVKKAAYSEKDQTYMLYKLTQEQLAATLMPLGGLSKNEVRRIAKEADLPVAGKPDSQEVCFVTAGKYADHIKKNADLVLPGEGPFVDEKGNILGKHKGIIHYTVGQRKGLGVALGYPAYVKEIRLEKNEVVIGEEQSLYSKEILCRDPNFTAIAGISENEKIACTVKIRYNHCGQSAKIESWENDHLKITFDEPVRAAAPGQSAVFYDDSGCVLGGGIISGVLK